MSFYLLSFIRIIPCVIQICININRILLWLLTLIHAIIQRLMKEKSFGLMKKFILLSTRESFSRVSHIDLFILRSFFLSLLYFFLQLFQLMSSLLIEIFKMFLKIVLEFNFILLQSLLVLSQLSGIIDCFLYLSETRQKSSNQL